jgi:hypothetical protein
VHPLSEQRPHGTSRTTVTRGLEKISRKSATIKTDKNSNLGQKEGGGGEKRGEGDEETLTSGPVDKRKIEEYCNYYELV